MIQFNLLPDIKLTYISTKRNKHLVMVSSIMIAGVSLSILILLFLGVAVFQKQHLSDLSKDIANKSKKLQDTPELNKVLTIQNQLNSLTGLHEDKPAVSKIFTYLVKLTPNAASIKSINMDLKGSTLSISGNADSINTINRFVDTLKFTTYKVDGATDGKNAFSKVVLSAYSLGENSKTTSKNATYQIALEFMPEIFSNTKKIELSIPSIISTRSETEKPSPLFDTPVDTNQKGQKP